jgi:hypothetical protein
MTTLRFLGARISTGLALSLGLCATANAQLKFTVSPSSLNFGSQSVQFASAPESVTVYNTGTEDVVVTSYSVSPSQFEMTTGEAPWTIHPGDQWVWGVAFAPDSAQTFSGQLTLTITGYGPYVIPLSGTGFTSAAVAGLSTSSLAFGQQTVGTSSSQTITVSNTGTSSLTVSKVNESSLSFTVTGFVPSTVLNPGASLSLPITFTPSAAQPYTGTLTFTYKEIAPNGVTLSGTGSAPAQLTITTLTLLPEAVQQAPYLAALSSTGGVGAVTWAPAPGSQLPSGLTLSSSGSISGTLGASASLGNHSFTVQATDSNQPPTTVTKLLTLSVVAATGAECNNISWDVTGTTTPLVAITDLGTGTYFGVEGGLYPDGSNVRPASDDAAGVGLAHEIVPLDSNGNYDPNGKYAILGLGESIANDEFDDFLSYAAVEPTKNPYLVVVDGAMGGEEAIDLAQVGSVFWSAIFGYRLPDAGVSPSQVVAVWVEAINGGETGSFPGDIISLQADYETIAQVLHNYFPNLKMAYFSTRSYGGYSIPGGGDPEPYAYDTGYAVRGMIEDQLNGLPSLNYDPTLGPVMAPWLSWGSYYWANGLLGSSDGLVWACPDYQSDGIHPSASGRNKVADSLLNFFKTDDTTTPWFVAPSGPAVALSSPSLTFASQNIGTTSAAQTVTLTNVGIATLTLTSVNVTGANPGDFAQTNTCGTSVAVGGTCTINVTFTPAAAGARTASVSIADNGPGSPQAITLAGTGVGGSPSVTLSPTSVTFATQAVGTTSGAQVVTLTNTGSGSLSITSISIAGTNPSDFGETNTCGTSVAAGASCAISVTFAPLGSNTRTATASINDNASGSPQTVPLTGVGTAVQLAPASLSFASQTVGTTSPAQTVTLSNLLSNKLTISSVRITGTNPGDFGETNTCGSSVPAKGSCTISVTFTPAAIGVRTAAVSISDSGGGSPQTVPLTGTGAGSPSVTLAPTSLTFPDQAVGSTSNPQTVTLTNTGSGTLNITSLTLTGTDAAEFSQTNTCGASVAAGASCSISVTFKPQHTNVGNATLSVTDNATGSPQTVALSGIGTAVQLLPVSLTFGSQAVGTTSPPQTVTLTSLLPKATLSISSITIKGLNAGDFGETNTCSGSVPPKGSCTISVTFTPSATGMRTASLSITDNGGGSPQMVGLTGTGM